MGASSGKMKRPQSTETTTQSRSLQVYNYGRLPAYYCQRCGNWIYTGKEYTLVDEGRKICPMCYRTAVMVGQDFKPLVDNIKGFFFKNKLTFKQRVRILPVHEAEIRKSVGKTGKKCLSNNWTYLGLTARNLGRVQMVTSFLERECKVVGKVEVFTKTEKVSTIDEKTYILMAYGFPWLKAGATLAHEMLHTWFIEQGLSQCLDEEVEEGFCELVSYIWTYEQHIMEHDVYATKLRKFILNEIDRMENLDIRSTGFKKAKVAFKKYGNNLEDTLKAVCAYRDFPH